MDNGNQLSFPFHSCADASKPAGSTLVGLHVQASGLERADSRVLVGQVLAFPTSGSFKAKDQDSALLSRIVNSVRLFT